MDAIDTFKVQALDTMAATIGTLETEVRSPAPTSSASSARTSSVPTGRWTSAIGPEPGADDVRQADSGRMSRGFFGRLLGRAPRRADRCRRRRRVPTSDDLLAALDRVEAMVGRRGRTRGRRVPGRAGRPRRTGHHPAAANLGAGSPQAYSVMATATDYLPEAVGGYLRLRGNSPTSRPVDRGKSSLMVLIDQLDLLASTMDKVFDAVCRDDAAALVAHGRFLQEKFGTPRPAAGSTSEKQPVPRSRAAP